MDKEDQVYDLTRAEDVFACLEATAMAQASLLVSDPDAAAGLEKVTEALAALSLKIETGDLIQIVEKRVEVEKKVEADISPPVATGSIDDLVDFSTPTPDYSAVKTPSQVSDEEEDVIIDILTGERLR
jgi:hypothetical protein